MTHYRTLLLALLLGAIALPAAASEETDEIRAQIKALEARLDQIEQKEAGQAQKPQSLPLVQATHPAQPLPAADAAALAPTSGDAHASVDYNDHGLFITSADHNYRLHLSGYIQADNRTFTDSSPAGNYDQWLIRSARPIAEADFGPFSSRLMMDFGNNQTQLLDAYADYKADPAANLRLGKFKAPLGLERWESESDTLFVERAMPTNLVPYRDNGLMLYGNPAPQVEYEVSLTDGTADLSNASGDTDNGKDVTGRLFVHPFKELGLGVAGSYGGRDGSATNANLPAGFRTMSQATFFSYSGGSFADGEQWRINPQAMFYSGPLGVLGEYVLEDQDVRNGTHSASLHNDAWMAMATYVLTGEKASFSGVQPKYDFDPKNGQWGAFELVARADALHVDSAAFPLYASLSSSAREAREFAGGMNWYLNHNVKLDMDYAYTTFDGGAATGDRRSESVLMSRAQFRY